MSRSAPRPLLRGLLATAAALASGAVLLGGQPQAPPTFRSSVEAVQLSVIVTDASGNPVSGLTEADFEVVESNTPRPITTFSAIDIPIERTDRRTGEPDVLGNDGPQGRVYLIALDQMPPTLALRTRAFLRQFIERYFGPNDTAAVVLTTTGPRDSGQEFTSNPRLLLAAIDKFDGGEPSGGWAREKNFTGDLRELMRVIASAPGARKAMIFVSQGFGICQEDRPCGVDPYRLMKYRPGPLASIFSDINPDFQDAMSFATRNNIAVYPVDPAGLTTDFGGLDARLELQGLAELTGGFSLTSSNNFAAAFERLVRENSTYYVLGFNSGDDRRDGRYVSLEVRVRRPGLTVRTLGGYIAPRGKPEERRVPKTVLAAVWDAVASPMTTSGVPMRVFAAPFRSDGKNATIAITLEIAATKLNLVERDGAHRGQIEILFAVSDARNKRHPIYRHRAEVALKPETYERVSRTALRVLSQLPLPPGRYQLRASAGGAAVAGSVVYDLAVPDFGKDLAMSGVAISSVQTGRTFTVSPHARIDVALPGPPTTAREFSRDDTLTVFAEAYENRRKPHTVTFTIALRNERGGVVGTQTSERTAADKPARTSVYGFSPNLALDQVPPGRYAIHIEVRSSLDKRESLTRDIPITVR